MPARVLPGREGDFQTGLFGPSSVTWRVNREGALLLGGGRALLLQIAHPLVAAGVAAHSDFRRDPLGRLRRTLDTMLTITFGSVEEARRAYRGVNSIHARVRGRLEESVAGFEEGAAYRARDPKLLLWVHATLVDTAMRVYRRYVGELAPAEWETYYEETKVTARLFRIPNSMIPENLETFRSYMRRMLDSREIVVTATARDLAKSILYPPLPMVPSAIFDPLNLVTAGLLSPRLREEFGLPWSLARQAAFDASSLAIRAVLPLLPDLLRTMPVARAAERRTSGV